MFCSWPKQAGAMGFAALSSVTPQEPLHPHPGMLGGHRTAGRAWSGQITVLLTSSGDFCPSFPCILLKVSNWQDQSFCFRPYTSPMWLQGEGKQREIPFLYLSCSSVKQKERKKNDLFIQPNKKQLGKSITQPKSITLMKKIYKHRIVSLKAQASFRLNYKLFWKRNIYSNWQSQIRQYKQSFQPVTSQESTFHFAQYRRVIRMHSVTGAGTFKKITQPTFLIWITTDNSISSTRGKAWSYLARFLASLLEMQEIPASGLLSNLPY